MRYRMSASKKEYDSVKSLSQAFLYLYIYFLRHTQAKFHAWGRMHLTRRRLVCIPNLHTVCTVESLTATQFYLNISTTYIITLMCTRSSQRRQLPLAISLNPPFLQDQVFRVVGWSRGQKRAERENEKSLVRSRRRGPLK